MWSWQSLRLMIAVALMTTTTAESDVPCSPPPHSRLWTASLMSAETRVPWGTDKEWTCNSVYTCFPYLRQQPDAPLPVQILPVEIPFGTQLSFYTSADQNSWLPPNILYEVDANDFLSCDVPREMPALELFSSNESYSLNSSTLLTPGVHYFIGSHVNNSKTACTLGLRLNVTVKPVHCSFTNGDICSTMGLCLTQGGQKDYSCYCCGDHRGENCEENELCPCQHGGRCLRQAKADDYVCDCRFGFRGRLCEERVSNMCDAALCRNGGKCSGNATSYQCSCRAGFSGWHCEVNVNECASSPCINGLCVDQVNGYTCYCTPGYHGNHCELDYNECFSSPCENGGFCQDLQDNFTCHCHPGYQGRNCSIKIHPCFHLQPCLHGGHCLETALTYRCSCPLGFAGTHCEVDTDDCAGGPCLNGGTCVDRVSGYTCLCLDMHAGPNCQYPLDMFGPMIDIRGLHEGGPEERAFHMRNMYVVSGTLSCAVVVVLVVLVTCYCRVRATRPVNSILRRHHNYTRHHDDPAHPVDISSVSDARLTVDAIWEATSLNYDVTHLGSPVRRGSLKPLEV